MSKTVRSVLFPALVALFLIQSAGAITLGQLDDFQGGNIAMWTTGPVAPPVALINTGGPAGLSDAYIQLTADGSGAGGKLVAQNFAQWTGDYIAAGVTAIEVDLLNPSAVPLSIRIAFKTESTPSASGYLSAPMILTPGSGWQHFSISLAPTDLTAVNGPADYNTFFQNGFAEMRFINAVGVTSLNGTPVTAQLGIDNIRAVPEPSSVALGIGGLLLLGARIWHGKRRAG